MGRLSNAQKELNNKFNNYRPSRDLEIFCHCLVTPEVKGNKKLAMELTKVDKGKFYWAIEHKPEFRLWFLDLCLRILINNAEIPPYALLGAIMDKDVGAIRLYYELTGKLNGKPLIDQSLHIHETYFWKDNGREPADSNRLQSTELPKRDSL